MGDYNHMAPEIAIVDLSRNSIVWCLKYLNQCGKPILFLGQSRVSLLCTVDMCTCETKLVHFREEKYKKCVSFQQAFSDDRLQFLVSSKLGLFPGVLGSTLIGDVPSLVMDYYNQSITIYILI